LLQNHNDEKYSKWLPSEKTHQAEEATENSGNCDVLPVDGSDGGDSAKASQQLGKDDCINKHHHASSRHPTCNRDGIKDTVAPSHRRKDTSTRAANNTLEEAEDLKHSTDHIKVCPCYATLILYCLFKCSIRLYLLMLTLPQLGLTGEKNITLTFCMFLICFLDF
jgi:hypothetical protein